MCGRGHFGVRRFGVSIGDRTVERHWLNMLPIKCKIRKNAIPVKI